MRARLAELTPSHDAIVVAIVLAAAIAGVLAGSVVDGEAGDPQPRERAPSLSGGGVRLVPVSGWSRGPEGRRLPGVKFRSPLTVVQRAFGWRLRAEILPATSMTLVPRALMSRLVKPGRPTSVKLGRGAAYQYVALQHRDLAQPMHLFLAPTTGGVATVACTSSGATPVPLDDCSVMVASLEVPGAAPLPLAPDAAYRMTLPGVAHSLSSARIEGRAELARATTPAGQASAAARIAAAYDAAAAALLAVAPPAEPVFAPIGLCMQISRGYTALSRAAGGGDRAAYAAARREIDTAEASLATAIEAATGR